MQANRRRIEQDKAKKRFKLKSMSNNTWKVDPNAPKGISCRIQFAKATQDSYDGIKVERPWSDEYDPFQSLKSIGIRIRETTRYFPESHFRDRIEQPENRSIAISKQWK